MKLSILDQGPISQGQTPQKALENMREAVKFADKLGYHVSGLPNTTIRKVSPVLRPKFRLRILPGKPKESAWVPVAR